MRKKILMIVGILIILIGLIFGFFGIKGYWEEENAGQFYEDLKVEVGIKPLVDIPQLGEEEIEVPIDFDTLCEKYPDVYAWITIPGTNVDYPVAQREGNAAFYLNHSVDGKKRGVGSIFSDEYNGRDFEDPNTVLYGHNAKNGSMFRTLHKFRDKKFFEENTEIIVYQADKILKYKIFAAYVYDNRHILQSFDFEDKNIFRLYLNNVLTNRDMSSNINTDVSVTEEDKILTLSTCTGNDEERYLVQAVLLSIQQR